MPKFSCQVQRTVNHLATFTVEAEDEDLAAEAAEQLADLDSPDADDKPIEWEHEDTEYSIESVDLIDSEESK